MPSEHSNHNPAARRSDTLREHPSYPAAWSVAAFMMVVLGAANILLGDLNQDEGWYLYAALRVAEGWLPYRDFAFTQGPMLPLTYGLFAPLIEIGGVGAGRIITWLLGAASVVLAWRCAQRLGGRAAGVMALALAGVNVYQSYFTAVVKTYSLCAFFLMIGVYALVRWADTPAERRRAFWLVAAGCGLAAAAGTRLSTGMMLPVVGLALLFAPSRWGRWSWWWFGVGGGVTLALIFLPLYRVAPDGFRFGLLEFHTLRDGGSGLASLVYKGGFISRLVQAYPVATALLLLMALAKLLRPFSATDSGYHQTDGFALIRILGVGVLAITLVHIAAPFPYDDYQTPIYPVLALVLAVSWSYALRAWSGSGYRWRPEVEPADPRLAAWMVWSVVVLSGALSFASPINQDWMIAGRDRIWWNMKSKPSLVLLRETAREIKELADDGPLLTQDTYLAVEAGLHVPRGWEMGPFSYYPELTDERADLLHLVNRRRMIETLTGSPARVAAFSGYGLAIQSPEVIPVPPEELEMLFGLVRERYAPVREVAGFGQAATTLRMYRLLETP